MHPPRFWNNPPHRPGWQARALAPLGALYASQTAKRLTQAPSYRAKAPVICVGNLNAGGTGKTPTVIALIQHLQSLRKRAIVVSRGYGGTLEGPVVVDDYAHKAKHVGDEPLLLSAFTETIVAKDRAAGVRAADELGAEVIILDDGFQNPSVEKALSLVVVDAGRGFGNGRCIPAGPLREPVDVGLARADALLSIGTADAQDGFETLWGSQLTLPRLTGSLEPLRTGMRWDQGKYFAFAGIGDPSKFFKTLKAEGVKLVGAEAFADHQPITTTLIERILSDAGKAGAQVVTTEKDAVRLPEGYRHRVRSFPVRLKVDWGPIAPKLTELGLS